MVVHRGHIRSLLTQTSVGLGPCVGTQVQHSPHANVDCPHIISPFPRISSPSASRPSEYDPDCGPECHFVSVKHLLLNHDVNLSHLALQ